MRTVYVLMKCVGCGRGGLATIYANHVVSEGLLGSFFPSSIVHAKIPENVPPGIVAEYREAELCIAHEAHRAASALLRSALEKTLTANGYSEGKLYHRIEKAANDGVITSARKQRAHENIRVLGNDVVHDDWREVTGDEVEASHHYVQRILEDFYDDRATIESILRSKGRI